MNSEPLISGQLIEHPAAWHAEQISKSSFWQMELPPNWQEDNWPKATGTSADSEWFSSIQNELEHGLGAVLIKGKPINTDSLDQLKVRFREFCSRIGTPISQSAAGETVFSVRDEGFGKDDSRTRGPNTRNRLSFHTDRCDVIAFLCLRSAKSGGDNQVVSSMALYNRMLDKRPDLVQVLCEPFYYQRHNVDVGNDSPFTRQPIFSFFKGRFASNFLRVLIDRAYASGEIPAMTEQQKEALDLLEELASDPELHFTFRQEPGDILLLNNWVTYHRRTAFEDYEEPEKRRHLLRVWLSMPNSRELDPMFAGNYGATAAGAIRGGMRPAE